MPTPLVVIRQATTEHFDYVRATWFRSFLKVAYSKHTPFEIFNVGFNARMSRIFSRSTILVAEATSSPLVVGFIVFEPGVLHWVYVRNTFRRVGVGSELLRAAEREPWRQYTHEPTKDGEQFIKMLNLKYNPEARLEDPES